MNPQPMTATRIAWIAWCGIWSVLWFLSAIVQAGFNPLCDIMVPISAACMFVPVGKPRVTYMITRKDDRPW